MASSYGITNFGDEFKQNSFKTTTFAPKKRSLVDLCEQVNQVSDIGEFFC